MAVGPSYQARLDRSVGTGLARLVAAVWRRPRAVVLACAAIALLGVVHAVFTLRIQSDNVRLVADGLPFRQVFEELIEHLPVLNRSLIVLVESDSPLTARDTADQLALALRDESSVRDVYQPGGGLFFRRNALLYLDVDEIDDLIDRLARLQPALAQVDRSPEIGPLVDWARDALALQGVVPEAPDLWIDLLDRLAEAARSASEGRIVAADWSEIVRGTRQGETTRAVLFVEPRSEYRQLAEAGDTMRTIRRVAAEVAADAGASTTIRITGYPALAYEEVQGLLSDTALAGLASLVLAACFLRLSLRSWRLVAAGSLTLLVGLGWTAGFASLAIGSLNIISVLFAVLFIGLGVDFAIHLGIRYLDGIEAGLEPEHAMCAAVERAGGALALCAATTAIGFYSFVPTDYKGVAELGLIAGTGMLIIFFLSVSFHPALLALGLRPERVVPRSPNPVLGLLSRLVARRSGWICGAALLAMGGGLFAFPALRFDANVIKMRDPGAESVQAFEALLSERGIGSPWYIDVLAVDAQAAEDVAQRVEGLDSVDQVVTLRDWVPDAQEEKLALLEDAALLLETPSASGERVVFDLQATHRILVALQALIAERAPHFQPEALRSAALSAARALERFLARVEASEDPEALIAGLEVNLIGRLPSRLAALRDALEAERFGVEELPAGLLERMRTRDGRIRVQIYPAEDLNDPAAWERFADGVRSVEPRATGLAINLLEFGRVTMDSLRQAFVTALIAITGLLWLVGHRREIPFVMLPLVWAGIIAGGAVVLAGIELNFANVVVLPLLFGIGVDSTIHLVSRWREDSRVELGTTSTARAVLYSALTTAASFGTLALSAHRGVASLGLLLLLGLACTLLASLVVLPAILTLRRPASP